MMRAFVVMLVVAGLAVAAPRPFVESRVPEVVLETGNGHRAEALKRRLATAEVSCKVACEVRDGGRYVVVRLAGARTAEARMAFAKAIDTMTRRAEAVLTLSSVQEDQLGRAAWAGRLRYRSYISLGEMQMMQDQDIRINPPAVVKGGR